MTLQNLRELEAVKGIWHPKEWAVMFHKAMSCGMPGYVFHPPEWFPRPLLVGTVCSGAQGENSAPTPLDWARGLPRIELALAVQKAATGNLWTPTLDQREPLLPPTVNPKYFEPEFALAIGFTLAAPKEQTLPSRPCGA
eukprot:4236665-Pyramimonas_sp.AAC.1